MDNVVEMNTDNIVLTNDVINSQKFVTSFSKLRQMPFKPKAAYTIGYIANHVDRHIEQGRKVYLKMTQKYCELDDNGNFKFETDAEGKPMPGQLKFKSDEDKEKFDEETKEFLAIENTINKRKLTIQELGDIELTPNDIAALAPLFSDLD